MKVLVSARVLEKEVGGNTRYARAIYDRLGEHGVTHETARPPLRTPSRFRSAAYAVHEGVLMGRATDADLIHFPADTGAWIGRRLPIVGTVHGLASQHVTGVRTPTKEAVWMRRVAMLVAVSAKVITVSESSAADIRRVFPEAADKVVPIYHGLDHARFTPQDPGDDQRLVAEAGVAIDSPFFLYVGNIDPRKNLPELLDAASSTYQKSGVPLVVCGAPAWGARDVMRRLTGTVGVRYLGRVSDDVVVALMRRATAFCFPSQYEGFGFPVLEAMACGTPVICSDRGSLKELATGAAEMLSSLAAHDIAAAMSRVLNDAGLVDDLRSAGLARASAFTWDRSVAAHVEVFSEAVAS